MRFFIMTAMIVFGALSANASKGDLGLKLETADALLAKSVLSILGTEVAKGNVTKFTQSKSLTSIGTGLGMINLETYSICVEVSKDLNYLKAVVGNMSQEASYSLNAVGTEGCQD